MTEANINFNIFLKSDYQGKIQKVDSNAQVVSPVLEALFKQATG